MLARRRADYVRGRFAYANRAAASLLGVPRSEDLIGKGPFDILHPDWEEARERNERLYAGELLVLNDQRGKESVTQAVHRIR